MKSSILPGKVRLRRISHPFRVTATVCTALLLSTAGFMAGHYFQAPDLAVLNQEASAISVWSPVENRIVDDRQSFSAVVMAGQTIPVPARSAIEPAILVRQGLGVGAQALSGSLAGVISGQPYFLLRDLKRGDTGDDVLALQRSMNAAGYPVAENGTVDGSLLSQVAALFASDGYELPKTASENAGTSAPSPHTSEQKQQAVFIPYLQLLPIPAEGGTVVSSLPVGGGRAHETGRFCQNL